MVDSLTPCLPVELAVIPHEMIEMVVAVGCTGIVFWDRSPRSSCRSSIVRRNFTHAPSQLSGIEERLARIEQAVEAVSIEVERISEGQRFTTKLLADRDRGPQDRSGRSSSSAVTEQRRQRALQEPS